MFKCLLTTFVLLGINILSYYYYLFCLLSLLIKCSKGPMIQEGGAIECFRDLTSTSAVDCDTVTDQVDNVREMIGFRFV